MNVLNSEKTNAERYLATSGVFGGSLNKGTYRTFTLSLVTNLSILVTEQFISSICFLEILLIICKVQFVSYILWLRGRGN